MTITRRTTRALFAGLCLAALVMASLLSNLLLQEVRGLPPGDIEDRVVDYSDRWHQFMEEYRLDVPVDTMRARVEAWQNVTWAELDCLAINAAGGASRDENQEVSSAAVSGCSE